MNLLFLLVLLSVLCCVAEVLIMGGVLAVLGLVAAFGVGVVAYFEMGGLLPALAAFFGTLLLDLLVVVLGMKVSRRLGWTRRLFLDATIEDRSDSSQEASMAKLVGHTGVTATPCMPSGFVVLDGQRYEAVSRSGGLASETPVRVVAVDRYRIIVVKAE